jgi:proteasome lid subunit RPN8/RPN11
LDDVTAEEVRERLRGATDGDEVKRLVAVRETLAGRSPAEIADRFGWSTEVVKSWIGLIERDGLDAGTSTPPTPPARGSRSWGRVAVGAGVVAILLVLGVQAGVLSPGALIDGRPGAVLGGGSGSGVAGTPVGDTIELSTIDVQYMNRVFEEQDTEVAYCGVFDGQQMQPRLANLTYSDRSHARFTAEDCRQQSATGIAMIHTHPNGNPELSPGDRESFRSSDFVYTCIQHGKITLEVGAETANLRCYEGSEDLRRVPIRVIDPAG